MKCEEVSKDLIAYLDRRINSGDRAEIERHLSICAGCHTRAEDFRKLWGALDEVPMLEPTLAFDARVRARIAAEPGPRWFRWLAPQSRLAFSVALLLALSVWMVKLPAGPARGGEADFEAVKDLGVLENYDVLTKFDALSELAPVAAAPATTAPQQNPQQYPERAQPPGNDGDL
jgi:predicted anti-sigma-YlaC factor YlaD